jgi:WD40 repeat protein
MVGLRANLPHVRSCANKCRRPNWFSSELDASRVNDFQSDISGRRGWAGGSGCSAVAVSQNGLLIAAADGGGTVVIFRKFPEWEIPEEDRTPRQDDGQHETRLDLVPDKGGEGGMSFSPTSSYAGSHSPASLLSLPHAEFGYQAVATLRHAHRVRSLSWATEPGWPVLAAGSADGRVRIWRPMGEGEVEVNVEAARLKNIKPGKEVVYAVISVGRKIRLGTESVLDWTVDFAKSDDNAFVLYNSRQVINVVLYVRPKTRQSAVQGEFTRSDSLGVGDRGGPQLKRADSLGIGDSQGEGSMAKLIKKKEALVRAVCI